MTSSMNNNNNNISAALLMENRIRRLEVQLGNDDTSNNHNHNNNNTSSSNDDDNIEARLNALERHYYHLASSSSSDSNTTNTIHQQWDEIDQLLNELSAGTALTYQQTTGITAPIIYRRQEVLAAHSTLQHGMDHIGQILHNLLIGRNNKNTAAGNNNNKISEEDVANAPILIGTSVTQEQYQRLDTLIGTILDLQSRTELAAKKIDQMVYHYHTLVNAVSEKLILTDEMIIQQQQQQQKEGN